MFCQRPEIRRILDQYADDRKEGYTDSMPYKAFTIKLCVTTAMDPANRKILLKDDIVSTNDVGLQSVSVMRATQLTLKLIKACPDKFEIFDPDQLDANNVHCAFCLLKWSWKTFNENKTVK
jgi:hypothetical protein